MVFFCCRDSSLSLTFKIGRRKREENTHTLSLVSILPSDQPLSHFFEGRKNRDKGEGGRGEGGGDLSPFILIFVAQILIETNALIDRPA
jgi:hypothetical protein